MTRLWSFSSTGWHPLSFLVLEIFSTYLDLDPNKSSDHILGMSLPIVSLAVCIYRYARVRRLWLDSPLWSRISLQESRDPWHQNEGYRRCKCNLFSPFNVPFRYWDSRHDKGLGMAVPSYNCKLPQRCWSLFIPKAGPWIESSQCYKHRRGILFGKLDGASKSLGFELKKITTSSFY
jgi:hypothetical protein